MCVKKALRWLGIAFVVLVAIGVIANLANSTNSAQGAEPRKDSFSVVSDPPGARVTLSFDSRKKSGKLPMTLALPEGTDVTYSVAENLDAGLKGASGTFKAPKPGETVSIYINRMTADEINNAMTLRAATRRRKALEDAWATVTTQCNGLVKNNLKAPSTAKFPGAVYQHDHYVPNPVDNTAIYSGYVDSQNSFGAMLRTGFTCTYDANANTIRIAFVQ